MEKGVRVVLILKINVLLRDSLLFFHDFKFPSDTSINKWKLKKLPNRKNDDY